MTLDACPRDSCTGTLRLMGTHWPPEGGTTTFHECGICGHYVTRTQPAHDTPTLFDGGDAA